IGAAHLEAFHDFAGVAEEKGDLLASVPVGGTVFIPFVCPAKDVLLRHAEGRRVITFGAEDGADVQGLYGGQCDGGYRLTLRRRDTGDSIELVWPIGGEVQAANAAGAAAVGLHFGLSLEEIAQALPRTTLPGARMAQFDHDGIHWVNDAYNANPTSMMAGLKWFAEISRQAPSRTLLLGDMLELGPASARLHEELLQAARRLFPHDRIVTVGPQFAQFAPALGAISYPDASSVFPDLQLERGTWIYLKSSFGTGLCKLPPKQE
ncbi:MAG: hypothetical protein IJJ33_19860, partial [Victivallales bacterium]|nr:hypothetical protein [Victivallales bacterium]